MPLFQKRILTFLILSRLCAPLSADGVSALRGGRGEPYEPRVASQGSWHVKSFLEDAGLTGRWVFFVDFDHDGNAWIASAKGLLFYDGYTWTRLTKEDGLPSSFVRCLRFARDGTLWIGTDKGIATLDAGRRISIPEEVGLAGPNVRRIVEDEGGTLWFCSDTWLTPDASSGLAAYRDGQWTVYRQRDGLPSDYISDFFQDSTGRQFALSRDGLAVRDGSRWSRPLEAEGFGGCNKYFWSITEAPSFGVLATTQDAVFVLNEGRWSRIGCDRPELVHLKLTTLSSGEVVTLSGHYDTPKRFEGWTGAGFVPLSDAFHGPGSAVHLTEAPDGSVWSMGYDLLLRGERSGGEWTEYPDLSAPQLVDAQGCVWFTAGDTVLRVSLDDEWESFTYPVNTLVSGCDKTVLGLSEDTVFRFAPKGVIVYGSEQTGVHKIGGHTLDVLGHSWLHGLDRDDHNVVSVFDGVSWVVRQEPQMQGGRLWRSEPDPAGGVYYLLIEESDGRPRLIHIDRNRVSEVGLPRLATGDTPRLHVDHRGDLWLYGYFGLFTLVDGVWQRIEHIPGERITGVVNGSGECWFSYDGSAGGTTGVGRLRDDSWSYFDLDRRPYTCGRNAEGGVFFGTRGVLYRLAGDPHEALSPLTLPVDRMIYRALQSPTGDIWIGLGDSVLRYRPDRVPPQTRIVSTGPDVREGESLKVTFRAVERFKLREEGTFTYSWRIGSGPWSEFGPAPADGLALALDTGRYALEVRARDEGLDIDPTPARTEFRVVATPWPQRPWFWPVTGTLFTGLALLGGAALVARSRARFHAAELERVVAERTAKLRESETRFRAMAAAAPLPIVILRESDGMILYANHLLGETLGIPSEKLLGRRSQEFLGDPSDRRKMFAKIRKAGYVQGYEVLTQKADGTPIWCLISLQRMVYKGQPALIGGFQDITERKHTAEELARAWSAAEMASRAKSAFLANLTHEVRTPVMAMLGAAETSARLSGNGRERLDCSEIMARNSRHLLSLFDNLLDVARLEAGKFDITPVRCSLLEILADVRSVAQLPNHNPNVEFRLFCESAIPSQITTDPLRLKQALINVVNNALKFTDTGHVHVRVMMLSDVEEPTLCIDVEDTGPGIPEAERERIFDAFEQAETRPGKPSVGVGLGLPLARSIAEELGGTLVIQNREGCGSTFTLCVPTGPTNAVDWVTPDEAAVSLEQATSEPHVQDPPKVRGLVLLAEDSIDARELIAAALREAGAIVTAVGNGEEAVQAASERVYDLVLMDLRMPVMGGIAATVELRRRRYLAPIVAVTASVPTDQHRKVLEKGFDDLWQKPMSLDEIVQRVSAYLQSASCDEGDGPPDEPEPRRSMASEARHAALVQEFARDLPARLHAIQQAVETGDLQAARDALHQLAGTGGIMGFMPLSVEAGRVLNRMKNENCLHAEDDLQSLETLIVDITRRTCERDARSAI